MNDSAAIQNGKRIRNMWLRQNVSSWKGIKVLSRLSNGWMTTSQWLQARKTALSLGVSICSNSSPILGDLESQQKLFFRGEKFNRRINGHFDEVLCSAISPSGKYMVTGGKDRIVRVWDIHNQTQIQSFIGHRDSITVRLKIYLLCHRMSALTLRMISSIQCRMIGH